MILENLQSARIEAMKSKDNALRNILSGMIDAIQKAAITSKGRVPITDELTNEVLIKYQKSVQEQVDTCPIARTDLKEQYNKELEIVKMYAPQMITDLETIEGMVREILAQKGIEPKKANRGQVMKNVMPELKGKVDGKLANQVIGGILQ